MLTGTEFLLALFVGLSIGLLVLVFFLLATIEDQATVIRGYQEKELRHKLIKKSIEEYRGALNGSDI